ncbi:MAG: gliding motility-associated ABC transporter substrate-binding protein GldG [Bacteroidota bacterium]|nr:gliding motility-associated ABC transporter substrate-binding protein GldG [Bacteroidota bacterium]
MNSWIKNTKGLFRVFLVLGIILFANILGNFFYTSFDMTEEKRYVLTPSTKELLQKIPDVMLVRVLLMGDFPAGFKRLQQGTKDIINQFRNQNGYIEYSFENPNEGSIESVNRQREEMAKDGILPTNLMVRSGSENKEQLIYPYAIINYGEKKMIVNLLENVLGADQETNLNNSISLLEYKMGNAIQKLLKSDKKNILITTGHGELAEEQTKSLVATLRPFYNIARINLDSSVFIKPDVALLMVPRPRWPFSEKNKFIIDQYVMNGGKVIWMVDGLKINLDSLSSRSEYIPEEHDVNLKDLLFKYGIRIEPQLVLDLECSRIPQVIGRQGDKPQIELFPWFYHPLVAPVSNHPIVRNIDRIHLEFPSTLDTIKTKFPLLKTAIIQSSQYSRYQRAPMKVSFEILRYKADASKFDKPNLPMGYLLEGEFSSLYENRVEDGMLQTLETLGTAFKPKSPENKMIVIADGDLVKNIYDAGTGKYLPMGYSKFEKTPFNGNIEFITNAIEYLVNDENILSARSKEVKLRLLDRVKAENNKSYWQFFNIGLPLILLSIFGFSFQYFRRKKYTK